MIRIHNPWMPQQGARRIAWPQLSQDLEAPEKFEDDSGRFARVNRLSLSLSVATDEDADTNGLLGRQLPTPSSDRTNKKTRPHIHT